MNVIILKSAFSVVSILAIAFLFALRRSSWLNKFISWKWSIILAFVILRVAPFVALYLVFQLAAQSDVVSYFFPQASAALQGKLVYRDFESHYAPLFPYILATGAAIWHDPRSIVLLMIVMEGLALFFTYLAFRRYTSPYNLNLAGFLYLLSPAPFLLVVLGGQEDLWIWTFGIVVYWLLMRRKYAFAGLAGGIGFLSTKVLFGLAMLPPIFSVRRPLQYVIGCCVAGIAYLILWIFVGNSLLMPLAEANQASPPNLWFTINVLFNGSIPLGNGVFSFLGLGVTALASVILFFKKRTLFESSLLTLTSGWIFTYALMMLLSPKSLGNYAAIFLMPLMFLLVIYKDIWMAFWVLLLNFLVSIQPSLWFRLGSPFYPNFGFLDNPLAFIEFGMELLTLITLAAILWQCRKWIAGNKRQILEGSMERVQEPIPVQNQLPFFVFSLSYFP